MSPLTIDSSIIAYLKSSTLLQVLSDDALSELAGKCRVKRCHRGRPIWLTGADVDFIGLVGVGFVRMVQSSSTGSETTLEIMGPGQIFGLLGVIAGCGCPLTAYGLTDTIYVEIPKTAFLECSANNHELSALLLERTAKRMHQKLDFMAKLSTGRAEERLASVLLMLAQSYSVEAGGMQHLTVPLTRAALGEMAGTTTETTIRTLSSWTQAGVISTDQQLITIRDLPALEAKLS